MMAVKFLSILFLVLFVLLTLPESVLADQLSITLSGNGEGSTSEAAVDITSTSIINQTNTADIQNNIDLVANTGNNTASNNTDGDTTISTGDINQTVDVLNIANGNGATNSNITYVTDVSILSNGTGSGNSVTFDLSSSREINQGNIADIENNVDVDLNTGGNSITGQTGGSNLLATGNITGDINIRNCINRNIIGGDSGFDCLLAQNPPPPPDGGPGDEKEKDKDKDRDEEKITDNNKSDNPTPPPASSGEILGVSILPLTGFKFNIWVLSAFSVILMILGFYIIRKSYDFELALVRKNRGRYYNKDEL